MSRTFTLAVERVADDRRFAERFRSDPRRALRRYRLDDDQADAIKSGEFVPLARHGLDVQQFQDGKRHGWRPYVRKAVVGVTVLGATLGLMGAPASAVDVIDCGKIRCTGPRISGIRKASLRQARSGRAVRIGRVLIRRSSIRKGLRRNGLRAAPGRIGIRAALRDFCKGLDEQCVLDGPDFAEPLVLAEAP